MSVINQVLNQLEQRGAHSAPGQTMVRAVPPARRKSALLSLILGLVLAIGFAAWQWMQASKPKVVAVNTVQHQPAVPAAAVTATTASADIADEAPLAEALPPASRLSSELSSVPLPSTLRSFGKTQDRFRSEQAASTRPLVLNGAEGSEQAVREVKNSAAMRAGTSAQPIRESAKPQPTQIAPSPPGAKAAEASSDVLPMKQVSPAQHADTEFRKAVALMQQGRIADALAGYEAALRLDPDHDAARQAWVTLLLEGKRGAEAERVLQDGLKVKPMHIGFAMLLARLQVERGEVDLATATLEKSLPYADSQAGYQAFFAALLQRQNRHKEAITHYQIALQLTPSNGIWLMGYGISLQAVQRIDDARVAFRRALESKTLSPELQAFVQMKIKEL